MEQLQQQIDDLRNGEFMKVYSAYNSAIYQPNKISINSKDDSSEIVYADNKPGFFNTFRINFKSPILNVRSLNLLKTTIPIITTNIPDQELVFWYYRLPLQTPFQEPVPPSIEYLKCIRIQPSYYSRDLVNPIYPINRYYNTYSDLLYDLNLACANDMNNPYFEANDIQFNLDLSSNKFSFTGNNVYDEFGDLQYFYSYAGYNDPNILIASGVLEGITVNNFGIQGMAGQPFTIGRTLNVRVGMVWSGITSDQIFFKNHLRPVPDYTENALTLIRETSTYTAESYACLVYSQNCNIYCNLTASSSYSSENVGTPNFLLSVPLNTSALGVSYYNNTQHYFLTHVPREIYTVEFQLRTDTNEEFYFPDSENINLEIGFEFY